MSPARPWQSARQAWSQAWDRRTPREQALLQASAWLLLCLVLWHWALGPAWRTWQEAPARQAALDQQTHTMQQLQAQAQALRQPSAVSRAEARQWLETSLSELGPKAHISLQGDQVTLRLEAAPAMAMARWLSQARDSAQILPVQAQMQQRSSAAGGDVIWQGTLVLRLPG